MKSIIGFAPALLLIACTSCGGCLDSTHYASGYDPPASLQSEIAWAGFRGPGGNGVADEGASPPTSWSATDNVAWKTSLPGFGTSSPIVIGDRIYLTCYSGYGQGNRAGGMSSLMRHVVCVNRTDGEIVWTKDFQPTGDDENYGGFLELHGYASNTPATDGEKLFVFFGSSGLYALDLDGNELWHASAGGGTDGWGSASSPVVYGDLVIVNASVESGAMIAFDKSTGEEAWRVDGVNRSWGTPIIYEVDGRHELALSMEDEIFAVDPASGRPLWDVRGINDYICSSMVVNDGVLYAIGARAGWSMAVRGGEVDGERVLWRENVGSNVTSPVLVDGRLYWVSDSGIAFCLDAATGETIYRSRLPNAGRVYASATAAGGNLYVVSRENGAYVYAANEEFDRPEQLDLGDNSVFNACPVVVGNELYLRSDRALYCIASAAPGADDAANISTDNLPAIAIREIIAADAELSNARNQRTHEEPLADVIDAYVGGLRALDYSDTPDDFRQAMIKHVDAWMEFAEFAKAFPDLRGEMHAVFEMIRETEGENQKKFLTLEEAIFGTWALVETSMAKHGVTGS